jgi:hypothetical protein
MAALVVGLLAFGSTRAGAAIYYHNAYEYQWKIGTTNNNFARGGLNFAAGAYTAKFQGDGNLVIYKGSKATWATRTASRGTRLSLQGDGNVVIYDAAGRALWATGTINARMKPSQKAGTPYAFRP